MDQVKEQLTQRRNPDGIKRCEKLTGSEECKLKESEKPIQMTQYG